MSKKNNPNSPDNLLGKWFQEIEEYEIDYDLIGSEQEYILARGAISHLLNFSDQHGKLIEMYNWLASNEGCNFLENHSRVSQLVHEEFEYLSNCISWEFYIDADDKDAVRALKEWAVDYQCLLPSYLTLK